jgi:hypothetical protein
VIGQSPHRNNALTTTLSSKEYEAVASIKIDEVEPN